MSTPAEAVEGDPLGRKYGEFLDEEDAAQGRAPAIAPLPTYTPAPMEQAKPPDDLGRTYGGFLDDEDADLLRRGRAVQGIASKHTADQYAEATKLGSEFGISAQSVLSNPEPYRKESARRASEGTLKDAPATRAWLSNLENAGVAQDDVENLAQLERGMDEVSKLTRAKDLGRSLLSAPVQFTGAAVSGIGGLYGAAERTFSYGVDRGLRAVGADAAADFLSKPRGIPVYLNPEASMLGTGGMIESGAQLIGPPAERQNFANELIGALGQIGGQIGARIAAGPEAAILMLLGQGADIQRDRALRAGASQAEIDAAVGPGAAITALTEKYQLDEFFKLIPKSLQLTVLERIKRVGLAGLGEAAQEITEGIGQNIAAMLNYEPDAKIFDLDAMKREGTVSGIAGAIAKLIIDAIVPGKVRSNPRADREVGEHLANIAGLRARSETIGSGEAAGKLSAELVRRAAATQLAESSPEALESLTKALKDKTGIEYAYVDAAAFRTLFQSDEAANSVANEYSGAQNTYYEAAISGTPIAVPIEKYLARIAPTLADAKVEGKPFSDFVAFDPEGLNGSEASVERDALFEEAKKAAERQVAEGDTDTSQEIYDDVLKQLVATGMEKRTAEFNANLTRWTFNALATRAGMDPLELYRQRFGGVRGRFETDGPAGAAELTQGALTETPEFKQRFGNSKVVDESGAPKLVYHGTNKEFDVFNTAAGPRSMAVGDWDGAHFTSDKAQAEAIAKSLAASEGGTARVVAAYLSAQNPAPFGKYRSKEEAQAAGHDSRLTENNTGLQEWTVFDPAQIIQQAPPVAESTLFQSDAEPGPVWISALTKAAENAKPKAATATEWKSILSKTPGVKGEEIVTTGVNEWLDEQGKLITKEAVIDYLRANQLVIEEREDSDKAPEEEEGGEDEGMSNEERRMFARRIDRQSNSLSQWLDNDEVSSSYMVNGEPDVAEDNFTVEATIEEVEEGGTVDMFTQEERPLTSTSEVELQVAVTKVNVESWEGGYVEARVDFPDGRFIRGVAMFTFDEDDGAIGELEPNARHRRWNENGTFSNGEIVAVENALLEIKLKSNRELSEDAQRDIRNFDSAMTDAAESLREGEVADAIAHLQSAVDIEYEYDQEGNAAALRDELENYEPGNTREREPERTTRHDSYQVPGGEEYTEFKMILPQNKGAMGRGQAREKTTALEAQLKQVFDEAHALREQYPIISERLPEVQARLDELLRSEDEINQKRQVIAEAAKGRRDYVSPPEHWSKDQTNIVAFVRFNARLDKDGKRVLFIEEIQSDWHQYGRKYGYQGDGTKMPEPVTELPQGWTWALEDGQITLRENGEWRGTRTPPSFTNPEVAQASYEARAVEMYNDREGAEVRELLSKQVPDAPLKKTWREMAFKRMLRYAADHGFDRIAWTPGKVQAERYNATKFVDAIRINREADGQFSFVATKDGESLARDTLRNQDALAGYIGKELAAKAAKLHPGQEETFTGDNLRVDHTGLVNLYDSLIAGEVAKLVKQLAGGKIADIYLNPTNAETDPRDEVTTGVANGTVPVQSVELTPELRAAALAGLTMFQPGVPTIEGDTTGKRGSISWGADRKFIINLFEKRDLSTFLHESGHLYLEILGDLAESTDAPQQIKDDYTTLLKWFKVKDRAGIGVEQHEQFARGFEAYLAEGKSPSVELEPAFFRFRQWMAAVYKSIRNLGNTPGSIGAALNVTLTDEVRAVMDRMVATDEQIAQAEQSQQYAPIFTNAEAAGMSATEWSAYRAIVDRAHREGVDELTSRAMAQLTREKKKWWREERAKLIEEVTAEANASPVYKAIAFLTRGKNPDGSALAEGTPTFKLSRADVVARFGEDAYTRLPRGSTTTAPEGITAETAAQMLGFPSGADMVRAMIAAPPKRKAVVQVADARMRERHGDMMLDGSLVEQAIDSVHTEGRAKVLAAELKALNRKRDEVKDFVRGATDAQNEARRTAREANEASLPTRDEMRVIRTAAQRAIAAKKIRTITPALYRNAERKAAKRTEEMLGKGKFEEAYLAKRQQILNYELYRAATDARTQIDKQVEYMRRLSKKPAQERLAKAKGQYREQINALLARFDFSPQPADADLKRDALAKWVDAQIAAGREVTIPQWVIDEARTTPYKELTAAELTGLTDAAKNIEHLAKTKDRLLRNRAAALFEAAKVELETRARESLKGGKAPPVSKFEEGLFKEYGRGTVGFFNSLLRPETITEWLDGGQSGPWHDFLMEPANNAEYARESLRTKILEPMRQLANKIDSKRRAELEQDIRIESLGQTLNRRTLISIALNMGNASNLERLLKGGFRDPTNRNRIRQFTPESLTEIKDKLNAKDWQFIQEMWNTAESLWPELKAFQERMGGLVPEKIPATPVVTRFGTFTGGYWPAVYDSLASKAGAKQADSADALGILMGGNFSGVNTSKSALQERTGAGGPLKLDFSAVMGRHLDQVITDITHREFAIQAMRILDDPDLSLTLQDTIGEVGWHSLRGMVGAAIQQDSGFADLATKDIDNIRRRFISNLAVAALGLKVTTAFGNMVLAPVQAAARVNPKYILTGIAKYMRHPIEGRAFVDASSAMMRNRAQNMDASFSVIREKLEGRNSILAQTQRAAMSIHQAADHLGTTGIWLGRYQQALDAGETHEESVRLADKAIRITQTAGAPKDLSAFERNPAYRELKLFIGPMIIMNNRMRESVRGRGVIKSWPEAFGTMLAVWFLPAILWDILNGRGPDDDDDDDKVLTDEFLPYALRKLVAYPFATLPYWREAVSLAERKFTGKYAEARMNPVSDAAWLVLKTGKEAIDQIGEGDEDDSDDARKYFKLGLQASGPLIGLPTNQIDITGSYMWDYFSGEYDPEGPADMRYLLMRRPKDK